MKLGLSVCESKGGLCVDVKMNFFTFSSWFVFVILRARLILLLFSSNIFLELSQNHLIYESFLSTLRRIDVRLRRISCQEAISAFYLITQCWFSCWTHDFARIMVITSLLFLKAGYFRQDCGQLGHLLHFARKSNFFHEMILYNTLFWRALFFNEMILYTGFPPSGKIRESQGKIFPSGKSGKVWEFSWISRKFGVHKFLAFFKHFLYTLAKNI